jgi:ribosome-associated protein
MTKSLKDIVINSLEEIKAIDITLIDVRELTGIMDTMVVASGNSNRQVKALANAVVMDAKAAGYSLLGIEGENTAEWILVDFGEIIIHIMLPATRAFYDLERLWSVRPSDAAQDNATSSSLWGSGNDDSG